MSTTEAQRTLVNYNSDRVRYNTSKIFSSKITTLEGRYFGRKIVDTKPVVGFYHLSGFLYAVMRNVS